MMIYYEFLPPNRSNVLCLFFYLYPSSMGYSRALTGGMAGVIPGPMPDLAEGFPAWELPCVKFRSLLAAFTLLTKNGEK